MARALALSTALLAGGCGIAGGSSSLGPTTTQAALQAHLTIDPGAGPIGTLFTLTADGMTPGIAIQFEITFPGDGHAYPGNALVVAGDGTASTTYRATTANQPGQYAVRLTGPKGQLATGQFQVTDGPPLVSSTTSSSVKSKGSMGVSKPSGSSKGGTSTTSKSSSTSKGATSSSTPTTKTSTPRTTIPTPSTPPHT